MPADYTAATTTAADYNHYAALRRVSGDWFYLDSQMNRPYAVTDKEALTIVRRTISIGNAYYITT